MDETEISATATPARPAGFWPEGWWRVMDARIGVVPIPVFAVILALIAAFAASGKIAADLPTSIAVLAVGGFACAELGKRLPGLRQIGAAAILATFIPSYLVYAHLLPAPLIASITDFTKASNVLYLFIAAIVVGSIFGMDRRLLVTGFAKIFVPLATGSLSAMAVGTAVGWALGLGLKHSFFFIVVPILAGGVGEGAFPLSVGYAAILHQKQGDLFAQILPAVMLGGLTAILIAGGLNLLGKRRPGLTGEGRLQPGETEAVAATPADTAPPEVGDIAAAAVTAVALYLIGVLAQKLSGWPAPVVMLALAVLLKLGRVAPPRLEAGAAAVFRFFATAVTYPLLFAIGVALTPWDKLVAAFNLAEIAVIIATVATLIGVGFLVAPRVGLYPIDAAVVNACHSGQGGTGDVAILTAANRMALMPFAQIATRIGGALTVIAALALLRQIGG